MITSAAEKEFIKLFESLAYTQSYHTVFTDFLDFALRMFRWDKKPEDFKDLETRWPKPEDQQKFAAMLIKFSEASDQDGQGFHDCLGDLFMELLSHGRNGQFFTPQPICDMISAVQFEGQTPQDGQTVCDPACGSGRMLLAAARYNRKMKFYGADSDITCCKMSVLNMLINTMEGEVAWMNSLTMEHWKSWHIKKVLDGSGHYLPYYFETGPGETHFIQRLRETFKEPEPALDQPEPVSPVVTPNKKHQLTLF